MLRLQGRSISPRYHPGCHLPASSVRYNGLTRARLLKRFTPPAWLNMQPEWRVRPYVLRWHLADSHPFHRLSGGWLTAPFLAVNFVDPEGFEPSTFSMPLRRAPNCAMGPYIPNGPGGIRTLDLISAIDARSQLRYRPVFRAEEFYPFALCVSRWQSG